MPNFSLYTLVVLALGVILGCVAYPVFVSVKTLNGDPRSSFDAATFGLAVVQVMLAVLALGLAALAIFGYQDVKRAATNAMLEQVKTLIETEVRRQIHASNSIAARHGAGVESPGPIETSMPATDTGTVEKL